MKLTCIEVAFCVSFSRLFTFFSQITAKSHHSGLFMLNFTPHSRQFTQTPVLKTTDAVMLRVGNTLLYKNIDFMPSGKQSCCWRGPGFRHQVCSGWSHHFIQVSEYLPDHNRVFNTSNDPDVTAAFTAGFYVNVENPLQPLCPGH